VSDNAPFAAVVLVGGHSRRMGTDKAGLRDRTGQPLLGRQLALLASLRPVELLVSARRAQVLPPLPPTVRRVDDDGADGPLGGIVAAFEATATPRLLVVAVDLPELDQAVLKRLIACPEGAVPVVAGHLEPLVAVYPRRWLPEAQRALRDGQRSLQQLLSSAKGSGFCLLNFFEQTPFVNWNRPHDYSA
jgi:molybdenum cofactor guanylyltransferase